MRIDDKLIEEHGAEFAYLLNHFLTEHLVRVSRAFDGDLTVAVVLGTIAHHNLRSFHEQVVGRDPRSMQEIFRSGRHREDLRPCNALSVTASTGIPRETVRRKIAWLVAKGWVRREGRDRLFIEERVAADFALFNLGTVDLFRTALVQFSAVVKRRRDAAMRSTGAALRNPIAAPATGRSRPR